MPTAAHTCNWCDLCQTENDEIRPNQTMLINDKGYKITAVGNLAKKNLENLGHLSFVFNGATDPELPGSIYLEATDVPSLGMGSVIKIIN